METKITEMLGIKYPVICGAMMWRCTPEFCATVSNTGGIGNVTAASYDSGEELRTALRKTRKLTDKPFGVNITYLPSFRVTKPVLDDFFMVSCEERVSYLEISGLPITPNQVEMAHEAGVKLFHKCGSVEHARHVEDLGYDGVFAAGYEIGGHPHSDNVTNMILIPRIVESVNIPVVSVGGIADGRGMAAALCLGAEGVMIATPFLATKECMVHDKIKKELVNRQEGHTTIIKKSLNLPGRALKNAKVNKILEIEAQGGDNLLERLQPLLESQANKEASDKGDIDNIVLMIGQSVGLIHEIMSCEELVIRMVNDAENILRTNIGRF